MPLPSWNKLVQRPSSLFFVLILALSYFTYFHNYWNPSDVFWDENYHIASAQKYLNGVFFMEQHPPLGKLLIAAGEKIVNANPVDNEFIGTDYAKGFEDAFSFAGYRFFPALLAWLTAPLFFFIFLVLTKRPEWATFLTFPYIFDNALVVHLRGAMLEGPLLFFVVATILLFLLILRSKHKRQQLLTASLWFGIALALVATTKLLGLVLILLIPAILYALYPNRKAIGSFLLLAGCGFLLTYVAVWHIHFALGRTVNPALPDAGLYQASPAYKEIIANGQMRSLGAFPIMLIDSLKFVRHYNRGTPRLDMCKPDENGSPFFFWPLGARSINYRWASVSALTYRYLYLQANPVVWWSGLLAVIVTIGLLVSSALAPVRWSFKNPFLLLTFTGLYVSYMIAISRIDRVLYLYHYFIPLLFTFILTALIFLEIDRIGNFILNEQRKTVLLLCFGALIFLGFETYRPLTYYEPITKMQLERRAFFPLWELSCVNCQKKSLLVVPDKVSP
ncbi:hypothetical protein A3D88_02045 [Candidatus Peribacteria bacterium RIFCSPHIGHO2_02_FULL_52_16]|nr:MAG: hypothetical protein A2706_00165 [Candidatus Peribacteria bacterium RIFCSPHIGHO2_01_FULL_51_35]OGJ61406.1 MAG: hypothetical protein A3D88_02045 [Candidatus Peribacteria bacterium RIFCSPHIGHO2_02_FULL_52_16]